MSVYMLTTRKGGTAEAMIAATRKLKAAAESHGAESVTLSQVVAGPDAGHWVIRIMCANWQSFGELAEAAMSGRAGQDAVAGLDAISEVVSRRVVAGVDL
ncbi:MAG: hypothetical protein WA864_05085 [Acetobacteraceae bacterium]|jgi:hypothetical protein